MARLLSCVILLAFAATTSGAAFQNGKFDQGSVPSTCNVFDLVGQFCVGGIQQTFDTTPGGNYRLSFALAGNYGAPPVIKPLAVTINGVTTNFLFDTTGKSQFNMGWVIKKIDFVASGSTSTVNFVSDVSASGAPCNAGAVIAHVRVRSQ